jgi:oligopeptide/dipeptide ABC transporter ATP-binding protein
LDISSDEMRQIRGQQIAMIFQDPMSSLNPVFPVGRQIEESLRLHLNLSKPEARAKAVQLLDTVGIPAPEERVKDYPHQLSGGMQQRAMIAMAISCQPDLLIADEPTTALDVTIQAQVIELLAELRRELGMAVILITHELALVAGFCDRVAVMYAGYIVEYAPVHELFARPQHPYTLGLMQAVPTITGDRSEELSNIPGSPPDLIGLPQGCPYAPRCPYVRDACREMMPALEDRGVGHPVRCIVDPTTGELR